MIQIGKILFPTDFSPCSVQALDHALFFAQHFDAELHMLHAIVLHADDHFNPAFHFPNPEEIYDRLSRIASSEMASLVAGRGEPGVRIVHAQERGLAPGPVILDYARERGIDLIVMGTHGRRGPKHLLLGSVAEEVVRQAPIPVVTLRECREGRRLEGIHHILAPIDFSEHSRAALQYARELAGRFRATLQLLHVVEEVVYPAFYGTTDGWIVPPPGGDLQERSTRALAELMQTAGNGGPSFSCHVVIGRPAEEISRFAAEHASELIVMASHGLTGLDRLLFGSTAENVVRRAACPVWVLKPRL